MSEPRSRASSGQMSLLPPDEPARVNRVVEAGAGTGKTTSIVKSVVELLLENGSLPADRIVLVTFTEKAAGEIADRIRHALVELDSSLASGDAAQWPASGPAIIAIPDEDRAAAQSAVATHLQQIDLLRSQTIHSFCQTLLRMHPIEAGLDPQFALIDGFERARLYTRIYRDWFDAETRQDGRPAWIAEWSAAFSHLRTLAHVRKRIFALANRRDLIAAEDHSLGEISDFERLVLPHVEALRALPAAEVGAVANDRNRIAVEAIRATAPPAGGTAAEWLAWLAPIEKPLSRVKFSGRAPAGGQFVIREALQALRGDEAGKAKIVADLHRHVASVALRALAQRFIAFRDAEKDRRGVVDFDDLLYRAQRLLDNPEVLRLLRRRYDYIFVDEFQDTDRVQADIIGRLARNDDGSFAGGKTVLVGDPKQSIYGFRRADPETYAATVASFVQGGAKEEVLATQWRSDPQLVAGLNTLFERLFSAPGTRSVARPLYNELSAGREHGGDRDARFTFLHVDPAEDEEAHVAEARAIAAWILARDPRMENLRRYALLFRTRSSWPAYADTFARCGLPIVVQPRGGFLKMPAAVDLLTVLRAAALPFDKAAAVSAARSPYFGFSDDEIVRDSLKVTDGSLLKDVRNRVAGWSAVAERDGVAAAVDAAIADSEIEIVYGALQPIESAQMRSHLARFRRIAVDWDLAAGGSLRQFVEELARRQEEGEDVEPSLIDDSENAVRMLTAHASKGLEFDTVILPSICAGGRNSDLELYAVDAAAPTLVMKGDGVESLSACYRTADGVTLKEISTLRRSAEDDRLFYVAVTRAKEEVVFVADPAKIRNSGFWKSLNRVLDIEKDALATMAPANPGRSVRELEVGATKLPVAFERVEPAVPSNAPERFASPAVPAMLARDPADDEPAARDLPVALGRVDVKRAIASEANRPVGVLMHRVLELWDLEPATLAAAIGASASELGSAAAAVDRVRRRLARLESSPALARIRAARTVGRELAIFVATAEGAAVEKRIDRLVVEEGTYVVVDYKSGSPSEERNAQNREQVLAYCAAIERMSGVACRGIIWYIDDERDVAVEA